MKSIPIEPMPCPKCDGNIDAFVFTRWGHGNQTNRFAAYICSWCASLLLIDLEERKLLDPLDVQRVTGVDVLAHMRSNVVLWDAIERARKKILEIPNRRPVLR